MREEREVAPRAGEFGRCAEYWKAVASSPDAGYDRETEIDGATSEPMVTWGINPGHSIGISESLPDPDSFEGEDKKTAALGYRHMALKPGDSSAGTNIDVAFLGSSTHSRLSDTNLQHSYLPLRPFRNKKPSKLLRGKGSSGKTRTFNLVVNSHP